MTREVSYRVLLASVTTTFVATLMAATVLMRIAGPAGATAARFGPEGPELAVEAVSPTLDVAIIQEGAGVATTSRNARGRSPRAEVYYW